MSGRRQGNVEANLQQVQSYRPPLRKLMLAVGVFSADVHQAACFCTFTSVVWSDTHSSKQISSSICSFLTSRYLSRTRYADATPLSHHPPPIFRRPLGLRKSQPPLHPLNPLPRPLIIKHMRRILNLVGRGPFVDTDGNDPDRPRRVANG